MRDLERPTKRSFGSGPTARLSAPCILLSLPTIVTRSEPFTQRRWRPAGRTTDLPASARSITPITSAPSSLGRTATTWKRSAIKQSHKATRRLQSDEHAQKPRGVCGPHASGNRAHRSTSRSVLGSREPGGDRALFAFSLPSTVLRVDGGNTRWLFAAAKMRNCRDAPGGTAPARRTADRIGRGFRLSRGFYPRFQRKVWLLPDGMAPAANDGAHKKQF